MKNKSPYIKSRLNAELFSKSPSTLNEYFNSVQYFFNKRYIKDNFSFLDIGGAGGNLAHAIKTEVANIKATIIDPDSVSIELGKKKYPEFRFIRGCFPQDLKKDAKFDVVSMQALFPQIPNWKAMLLSIRKSTKKYFNLSLLFKLQGTTVVDKDISYFYYLDSGERVYQVVHNIYEFMNFLCIYEMGVRKIEFYGYHTPYTGHNFRCVPNSEQIKGNLMVEVFENTKENPIRMGGAVDKAEGKSGYQFFVPIINIVIDGKKFLLR